MQGEVRGYGPLGSIGRLVVALAVVFAIMFCFNRTHSGQVMLSPEARRLALKICGGVGLAGLLLVAIGGRRTRWDERGIEHRDLFGRQRLEWAQLTDARITRSEGGEPNFRLYGPAGRSLFLPFGWLGRDAVALLDTLMRYLEPWRRRQREALETHGLIARRYSPAGNVLVLFAVVCWLGALVLTGLYLGGVLRSWSPSAVLAAIAGTALAGAVLWLGSAGLKPLLRIDARGLSTPRGRLLLPWGEVRTAELRVTESRTGSVELLILRGAGQQHQFMAMKPSYLPLAHYVLSRPEFTVTGKKAAHWRFPRWGTVLDWDLEPRDPRAA